ncbi:hypothetical protein [Bradyrhizobium sp. BRP56]|uniref:hypothetical protein n=1 Tax=Bradyrhizobium sp. BRP56 TaxID=2793819 RepID=UPI001CD3DBDD|nr:hypothetical protein [Bradyrhizobium sp. BRP56]MCA1400064.1 hypothetical protein [Bradyrhizobium sp. BRP56]
MSEMQERVAAAMEKRRAELINQPLARIWPELAAAALEAVGTALDQARNQALEEAAQICERPVHWQHPLKPAGVVMSSCQSSPGHAEIIRRLIKTADGR